jgi:NADPH-dependent curcumin reductase CurA
METKRRSVVLHSRPGGSPQINHFALVEDEIPALRNGEVLTQTLWLSLDPYMRGRMDDVVSYAPSVKLGEPMTGETVGQVIASKHAGFKPGEIVVGARGWQSHIVSGGDDLLVLSGSAPHSAYLGVLGMPGATAYAGMKQIGEPKAGETVVVSAASGAVGSVAGQLARRAGARVVGVAGGENKCRFVEDELGFDTCIDYRAVTDLSAALRDVCPDGIDVYYENVGGELQHAVFNQMNPFGRLIMCGMVGEYNDLVLRPGPNLRDTFIKRLRIQGFIVLDRKENFTEWRELAEPWVAEGSLRYLEHVVVGMENAPAAFIDLLRGTHLGKVVVRVADALDKAAFA